MQLSPNVRATGLSIVAGVWFCVGGCSSEKQETVAPQAPTVATITVSPDTISLRIGERASLSASATSATGSAIAGVGVQWASSDTSILVVDQSGGIAGRRFGAAVVHASASGVSGQARVQVLASDKDSARISATDSVRLMVGPGHSVVMPPSAANAGKTVRLTEQARVGGPGSQLVLSIGAEGAQPNAQSVRATAAVPLAITVSMVVPATAPSPPSPNTSPYMFHITPSVSTAGSTPPLVIPPNSILSAISGTGASLWKATRSIVVGTAQNIASQTVIGMLLSPLSCTQAELPDSRRLYRVRSALSTAGAPPVLLLVAGWQPFQFLCSQANGFFPEAATWSAFLSRYFPGPSQLMPEPRLRLFEVRIVNYPSFLAIQSNGDDLKRLLGRDLPSRNLAVLAHSMGGLVTAAALKTALTAQTSLGIQQIIAFGTPWRGTPLISSLSNAIAAHQCVNLGTMTLLHGYFMAQGQGGQNLSDNANGYLLGSGPNDLRATIDGLVGRITAIRGDVRSATHIVNTNSLVSPIMPLGDCLISQIVQQPSDGVVPSNSAVADNTIADRVNALGLDHVSLYEMATPAVDPLAEAVRRLTSFLDLYAPVWSVALQPTSATIGVAQQIQLTARPLDETGAPLTRATFWASSDSTIAAVDTSGLVRGIRAGGPVTITATSEGKSASAQISVAATPFPGLTLVGSARTLPGILRLTDASPWEAGAAWTSTKRQLQPGFAVSFTLRLTALGGLPDAGGQVGADGIAFVIQNFDSSAVGAAGDEKGYGGIPTSLAIEFDTWQNPWDLDGNHVAIHSAGAAPNSSQSRALGIAPVAQNLSDGNAHVARIEYIPGSLRVYVDGVLTLTAPLDLTRVQGTNLLDAAGAAWIGFTSATGAAWEVHDILTWTLSAPSAGRVPPVGSRATQDRPDEVSGDQVHVMYVVPSDGADRQLDLSGALSNTVGSFQTWLASQTGGRRLRLDTYQGALDVSFFRLSRTNATMTAFGAYVRDEIEKELTAAGFSLTNKVYAVYYDGGSTFACGGGAWPPTLPGRVAALYLQGTPPGANCASNTFASSPQAPPGYREFAMLHEIMHTLGFVASNAPHHTLAGHVSDDNRDLMYAGPLPWLLPAVLDVGRDDYYGPSLPSTLRNFLTSSFLTP